MCKYKSIFNIMHKIIVYFQNKNNMLTLKTFEPLGNEPASLTIHPLPCTSPPPYPELPRVGLLLSYRCIVFPQKKYSKESLNISLLFRLEFPTMCFFPVYSLSFDKLNIIRKVSLWSRLH